MKFAVFQIEKGALEVRPVASNETVDVGMVSQPFHSFGRAIVERQKLALEMQPSQETGAC